MIESIARVEPDIYDTYRVPDKVDPASALGYV
jgi:hypothetical protein